MTRLQGMLRHQLPAYSPLSFRGIAGGAARDIRERAGGARELERLLAERYRAERVALVGSGTQALLLAIRSAMYQGGNRRVAIPAFSCYDVAAAAVGAGAAIAPYDLDPASLGPDLAALERELTAGAGVVVVSPLYGVPVAWDEVVALCRRYGAIVIEDAAQGHGASWRGEPLGSLGDISVLSFGRGKGWSGGGGGAALFRAVQPVPEAIAADERNRLVPFAKLLAQWMLGRPGTYSLPASIPWLGLGETHYRPVETAVGIPPLAAAVVLRMRETAQIEAATRRRSAEILLQGLRGSATHPVVPPVGAEPGYLRLPVRLPAEALSAATTPAARRLGVMRSYPTTLPVLAAVVPRLRSASREWPGAEELVRSLVTLPTHSRVTPHDLRGIVDALAAAPLVESGPLQMAMSSHDA